MWKSNKKLKLKEKLDWSVSGDNILTDYFTVNYIIKPNLDLIGFCFIWIQWCWWKDCRQRAYQVSRQDWK